MSGYIRTDLGYVDEYIAYTSLANAIVAQACRDYKYNAKKLNKMPDSKAHKDQLEYITKFFHSKWYRELTNANPEYILKMINKYIDEDDVEEE